MKYRLLLAPIAALLALSCSRQAAQPLFNGKDLAGWHALPGGKWEVAGGIIRGTSSREETYHGNLLSNETYTDFKVRIVYRALAGNSGFYFRCKPIDSPVAVAGFQAEISADGKDAGGLYETAGRKWVAQPSVELTQQAFRPGDWNEMTVEARGGNITVTLNGIVTARLQDDPGAPSGHFALQLHARQEMNVEFKTVELLP